MHALFLFALASADKHRLRDRLKTMLDRADQKHPALVEKAGYVIGSCDSYNSCVECIARNCAWHFNGYCVEHPTTPSPSIADHECSIQGFGKSHVVEMRDVPSTYKPPLFPSLDKTQFSEKPGLDMPQPPVTEAADVQEEHRRHQLLEAAATKHNGLLPAAISADVRVPGVPLPGVPNGFGPNLMAPPVGWQKPLMVEQGPHGWVSSNSLSAHETVEAEDAGYRQARPQKIKSIPVPELGNVGVTGPGALSAVAGADHDDDVHEKVGLAPEPHTDLTAGLASKELPPHPLNQAAQEAHARQTEQVQEPEPEAKHEAVERKADENEEEDEESDAAQHEESEEEEKNDRAQPMAHTKQAHPEQGDESNDDGDEADDDADDDEDDDAEKASAEDDAEKSDLAEKEKEPDGHEATEAAMKEERKAAEEADNEGEADEDETEEAEESAEEEKVPRSAEPSEEAEPVLKDREEEKEAANQADKEDDNDDNDKKDDKDDDEDKDSANPAGQEDDNESDEKEEDKKDAKTYRSDDALREQAKKDKKDDKEK